VITLLPFLIFFFSIISSCFTLCNYLNSSTTVRNFKALAQTVASNWRSVDTVTLSYCKSVAQVLKERHAELVNKLRSGLPSQHPKEQQQTKESLKPAAAGMTTMMMTMTPLAGVKATASWQQKPPPPPPQSFDDDAKTLMPIFASNSSASIFNLNQKLSVDENSRATSRPRSFHILESLERASATVTPRANIIFDEVETLSWRFERRTSKCIFDAHSDTFC
jgi:hypothetical protein